MISVPACFYRISVKALILNETRDKFLIVKESSGKWDFPGGGLDFGEEPHKCLRREIEEEMGIEVISVSREPLYFFTNQFESEERRGMWFANIFYEVTLKDLNFRPSSECIALQFVSPHEIGGLDTFNSVPSLAKLFRVSKS